MPAVANISASKGGLAEAERGDPALEQVTHAFNAPISFFGRVIDQYGNPVS